MNRTHFDATRREDGPAAVRYGLPITEADFDRLHKGHATLILRLLRYPPSLAISLLAAGEARYLPADHEVRQVPLLIGPDARQAVPA